MNELEFKEKCREIRNLVLTSKYKSKSAHTGTAFSAIEILVYLYYDFLKTDFSKKNPERDFFILSKGHAAAAMYAILYSKGAISKETFDSVDCDGSYLGDHINSEVPGVEYSLGSLGHGLSVASGIALSSKLAKINNKIVVLLGDGECNEGMVWEAASFAPMQKLNNLIAIVDFNKWQGFGRSTDFSDLSKFASRWESFGWNVLEIDGHDFKAIDTALNSKLKNPERPLVIIANTIKGKGVNFMEDTLEWHYKSMNEEQYKEAQKDLK